MQRLINAFSNSMRALRYLSRHEMAVGQELAIIAIALPLAGFVAGGMAHYLVLIGVLLFLLVVELLNTGIEKACDAVTRDIRDEIQLAKDAGSLAVLVAIIIAASVWAHALWLKFAA
jgi:diacylglycerol kinase (ATP)